MSIRMKTALLALVLVGLALTGVGYGLVRAMTVQLTANSDEVSKTQVEVLADQARRGALPRSLEVPDDATAQVVLGDQVLAASESLAGVGPITTRVPERNPEFWLLKDVPDDSDRETYRVFARKVPGGQGTEPIVVMYGSSPERVREATGVLTKSLLIGFPGLVLVLGGATYWLTGQALRPVDSIQAKVAQFSVHNLAERVPQPATRDEIGRLAETMNDMLARLEVAARREREFAADASHELRSPLARMMLQLETAQRRPDADHALLASLTGSATQLDALITDLLLLSRTGESGPPGVPVDLDVLVLEEAHQLAGEVEVDCGRVSAGPLLGHPEQLRRMIRNLLENAVQHAGSKVEVSVRQVGSSVELVISDDGPGIPEAEREKVFERFYRLDSSRSRASGGTGLGLAIAKAVVLGHAGSITLTGEAGLVVQVLLPTTPGSSESSGPPTSSGSSE